MKLSQLKTLLQTHRDKQFRLLLPEEAPVPISFHITEVGHVTKRFMDCGGRVHFTQACQLQAWVSDDTTDQETHRIAAGKMADVLDRAVRVLPEGQDLDVEIEYEDARVSQFPVSDFAVTDDAVVLRLSDKHTDCLAKDVCLPQPKVLGMAESGGCSCGPSGC